MKPTQCECCASPLSKPVEYRRTKRDVCDRCLGFMARWLAEIENANPILTLQPCEIHHHHSQPIIIQPAQPNPFDPPYRITC